MDQTTHSASSMPEKADAVPDVMKGSLDAKESPSSDDESQDEYISGLKLGLVLTALTVVYFLIMLDNTILATAIPFITNDFHTILDVGWYGSAYQLSCAALQPFTGKVYTCLASKNTFLTCLLLFCIGSAVCGAAQSSTMLIVGRAVAGMGGAGLMNGALIILNACVPAHKQPALLGILMALGQLGIAVGPLIGGALTEYASWRWCFYINLPIGGLVALLVLFIHIPDRIPKPGWRVVLQNVITQFDLIGLILFAPAAIQFFLALQYGGNQFAWNSATVIGLFCGAGIVFIIWLVWDYFQGENAMVPLSMFRRRPVWSSSLAGMFISGSVFVTAYYLSIYFQAVRRYSPFTSNVDVLPNIVSQMVFGMAAGVMIQRVGFYLPFMLAGGILNTIGCGLCSLILPDTPTGQWVGYQIVFGAGRGLAMSAPFLAVQHSLPATLVPVAMSTLVFMQNFGAAVMVVFAQTILTNGLHDLIPVYAPSVDADMIIKAGGTSMRRVVPADVLGGVLLAYAKSIDRIFYFAAGICGISFVFSWFMGWVDMRKKPQTEDGVKGTEGV